MLIFILVPSMLNYMFNGIEKLGIPVTFAPASHTPFYQGIDFFFAGFAAH